MNKHIETLIRLSKENPDIEIIPWVNWEVVCGDDYEYWKGEIEEIKKDYYYEDKNEEGYTIGKKAIIEKRDEELLGSKDIELSAEEDFQQLIKSGYVKEAIFIFIGV
jgi:hypothetical protein